MPNFRDIVAATPQGQRISGPTMHELKLKDEVERRARQSAERNAILEMLTNQGKQISNRSAQISNRTGDLANTQTAREMAKYGNPTYERATINGQEVVITKDGNGRPIATESLYAFMQKNKGTANQPSAAAPVQNLPIFGSSPVLPGRTQTRGTIGKTGVPYTGPSGNQSPVQQFLYEYTKGGGNEQSEKNLAEIAAKAQQPPPDPRPQWARPQQTFERATINGVEVIITKDSSGRPIATDSVSEFMNKNKGQPSGSTQQWAQKALSPAQERLAKYLEVGVDPYQATDGDWVKAKENEVRTKRDLSVSFQTRELMQEQEAREAEKEKAEATEFASDTYVIAERLLNNDEGLTSAVGPYDGKTPTIFGAAIDWEADLDFLISRLTKENLGIMKGVLSDNDIKMLKSIGAGELNIVGSEDRMRGGLKRIMNKLAKASGRGIPYADIDKPSPARTSTTTPSPGGKRPLTAFD